MNLSVSCLLDALKYVDHRADTLRIQIDGEWLYSTICIHTLT